jgi:hypothetical protein
MSKFPSI